MRPKKLEVDGKPVRECLHREGTHASTHTQADGQVENIKPRAAYRMGGGGTIKWLLNETNTVHITA